MFSFASMVRVVRRVLATYSAAIIFQMRATVMLPEEMRMREYWQLLAPGLHIEEKSILQNVAHLQFTNSEQVEMANLLKEEGYIQSSADWGLDLKLMADTVRSLSGANRSPVFAFLYDEFWHPFLKLHLLYAALFGGKYF